MESAFSVFSYMNRSYQSKMISLPFVIVTLLSCLISDSLGQSSREFEDRKSLNKNFAHNDNDNHNHQVSAYNNNEHLPSNDYKYLEGRSGRDGPPTTSNYGSTGLYSRRTSASWFQQHPIASPIRSSNEFNDPNEPNTINSIKLRKDQAIYSHFKPPEIPQRITHLAQLDIQSGNQLRDGQSHGQSDSTINTYRASNIDSRTTPNTFVSQSETFNLKSKDIAGITKDHDSSTTTQAPTTTVNSRTYEFLSHPTNDFTTTSSSLDFFNQPENKSFMNNDSSYSNPDTVETKYNTSPISIAKSDLSSSQNYQQSTINLSSIKTFESTTESISSVDGTVYTSDHDSSSEHPSNWWTLGSTNAISQVLKLNKENFIEFCQTTNLLTTHKQRLLCQIDPKIISIIAKGLKTAIDECQYQFSSSRWNCSVVDDGYHFENKQLNEQRTPAYYKTDTTKVPESNATIKPIFGTIMAQQNRERSFLSAIMSAGIAYALTKACSRGELPEECGCDQRIKNKSNNGKWEWGGCSEDVDYGVKFSREFTDYIEHELDPTSMINIHNYEVGRRVLKSTVDLNCKCHGVSGTCVVKTCWKRLGTFREIGNEIITRYERATHVQLSSQPRSSRSKLRPVKRGARKPNKKDLVFIDESPDYCIENKRLGILGTKNRRCNSTSDGLDSCRLLCCGRGYQNIIDDIEEDCECKFVWCCEVKCQKCKKRVEYDSCN